MNRNVITVKRAGPLIDGMAGESLHAKRVQSVTNAVVGVVNAVSLSIHAIGAGLAQTSGLQAKHAIKRVDRLLSNPGFNVWDLFAHWVPYGEALATCTASGRPWRSQIAMILLPLPRRVGPMAAPPFSPPRRWRRRRLR